MLTKTTRRVVSALLVVAPAWSDELPEPTARLSPQRPRPILSLTEHNRVSHFGPSPLLLVDADGTVLVHRHVLRKDLHPGDDGIPGSHGDRRRDDVNRHWFRLADNNPLLVPSPVDLTSMSVRRAALPPGHRFAANGNRRQRQPRRARGARRALPGVRNGQRREDEQAGAMGRVLAILLLRQAHGRPMGVSVIDEVERKVRFLAAPSKCTVERVLICAGGVTAGLRRSDDFHRTAGPEAVLS